MVKRIAAVVILVGTICAIFLFPLADGPFSATHGPVTALRAARSALLMFLFLSNAALIRSGGIVRPLPSTMASAFFASLLAPHPGCSSASALRC